MTSTRPTSAVPAIGNCDCPECQELGLSLMTAGIWAMSLARHGWRFIEQQAADGRHYYIGRDAAVRNRISSDHRACRRAALLDAIKHAYRITFA